MSNFKVNCTIIVGAVSENSAMNAAASILGEAVDRYGDIYNYSVEDARQVECGNTKMINGGVFVCTRNDTHTLHKYFNEDKNVVVTWRDTE